MNHTDTWNKPSHTLFQRMLIILLVIGIAIPFLFTLIQMGVFAGEPVVDTPITVTDPDAPVLRVATDYDFCPNSYINSDGQLSGLYIEIITEAANRMGVRPEFKTGEWLECRQMLTDNEVDVLLGLEIFSNMEGALRTIPICSDELRVYGRDSIDSAASLAGKRVALMARSVIAATYDLQCTYVEYFTNTEILQAVENGEVDYGICHAAVSSKIIQKNGFHLQASLPIAKSYPALAVDDSRPELRDQLNTVLQEMSRDGTIGRLQKKWITDFTKNKSFAYVLKSNELFYFTFCFGILVVAGICIAFRMLERQQNAYIQTLLNYQQQLKRSNDEANQANRAKSEFLSHMSHDIRTPMNGIIGMAEMIRRNEDKPPVVDECLDKIDAASRHLLSLLNDVLSMSELEHGKVRLERKPFDLQEELHTIETIVEEQRKEYSIAFAVHADGLTHTNLLGSPLHLRRILLNLISNAIKYNKKDGRVDLTVQELSCDGSHVRYQFTVADTGIGMSPEFLQKNLYQPFTQENNNIRTNYQGTGLGMSIVHELVKAMGGTIRVQSTQGIGTTFTVNLSFEQNPHAQPAACTPSTPADISGVRVLVVEDNELNREIAQAMLENAGAVVTTAVNGKEAVDLFAASAPRSIDAILMDIMMPVMDGMAAAQAIRALPRPDAKTVTIIAMTANAFEEDKRRTLESGMNAHLTKPVDPALLHALLAPCRKATS